MQTDFHLGSKDDTNSFFLDKCGPRGMGDSGEAGPGLSVALCSEGWIGDARGVEEVGDDRRGTYGDGRDFGCSSRTGELVLTTVVSRASDRSSRMARGGGRST
jgi:hypothetical protein